MSGTRRSSTPVDASSSLAEFTHAFCDAAEPTLDLLVGAFRATRAGPFWMRYPSPVFLAATGMAGWWGKQFSPPASHDAPTLAGHNLVERDGQITPSLPMTARVGPSRLDGRGALVLTYPSTAPWPWRGVTDEVRPLGDTRLVGLSFDIVPAVPIAVPFLLDRD